MSTKQKMSTRHMFKEKFLVTLPKKLMALHSWYIWFMWLLYRTVEAWKYKNGEGTYLFKYP